MAFTYKYRAKKGSLYLTGAVEAQDEEEATLKLRQQGLTIISLNKDEVIEEVSLRTEPASRTTEEKPIEYDVFTSERKFTTKLAKEEKKSLIAPQMKKIIGYILGGVFGAICLITLPFLFLGQDSGGGKDKNVDYNIVSEKDVRGAEPRVRNFVITVEKAASKNGIKDVAQKILALKKGDFKDKDRAMFHFFYDNQDVATHKAAAVLRWNWSGDGQWEHSFSLSRGKETAGQIKVIKKELKKREYIKYDIIVPSSVKVSAAKDMVGEEIKKLQQEWASQVKKVRVDAIYENFESPFMACEVDAGAGSYRPSDCRLITKRF